MINISPIKIMVIVTVILVLLGPDKLPEVARKLGSTWQSFKRVQQKIETEVREAIPDLPSSGDIVRLVRNPVHLLDTLADHSEGGDEPERWSPDSGRVDPHEVRDEDVDTDLTPRVVVAPPSTSSTLVSAAYDPSLN